MINSTVNKVKIVTSYFSRINDGSLGFRITNEYVHSKLTLRTYKYEYYMKFQVGDVAQSYASVTEIK